MNQFKKYVFLLACLSGLSAGQLSAQTQQLFPDSTYVKVYPKYDSVSRMHRKWFGENYRKEYTMDTKIPILRLSELFGGLVAYQIGGGNQTKSLRLKDGQGREWVLRKVEKNPEVLLPKELQETFFKELIKDNMSAQHPFSPLVVPILSKAAGVPYSNPIIGFVLPDPNLREFAKEFQNSICLLEEREPEGKSDNTEKMLKKLADSHDYTVDEVTYLKLKCLDVLIGDWDRHSDQWRWKVKKEGDKNIYVPVPRDRDQVFFRSDGKVQRFTQISWFLPMMQGYEREIQNINWYLWEGREINSRIFREMDEEKWNTIVAQFCSSMTNEVFEKALKALPEPGYSLRHDELINQLQSRRAALPELMKKYYHFFNRIVDIEFSDKNEVITLNDLDSGKIMVKAYKATNEGKKAAPIYERIIQPATTKEIRIYGRNGDDQLSIDITKSPIKIRVIGGEGAKSYDFIHSATRVSFYDRKPIDHTKLAPGFKLNSHISSDTLQTQYLAKDMYKRRLLLPNLGFNRDDGLAIGLGVKFTNPGFRKLPYASTQTISALYSFSTAAFRINYIGEWLKVFGQADLVLQALISAPNNTQNFFGTGNETTFDRTKSITYYRARFSLVDFNPYLRWRTKQSKINLGASFQYYSFDGDDNIGRHISQSQTVKTADSLTIAKDKAFAGIFTRYVFNSRDNDALPTKGMLLDVKASVYKGLNNVSENYGQLNGRFSYVQRLHPKAAVVITETIGGGINIGDAAFYQSQFLGGQGNLIGYRQFRYAGKQMFFNNLELRTKLADILKYTLPGEFGLVGLYDTGRVWAEGESSTVWHHGVGAGFYFSPITRYSFRMVAGYSKEGWFPIFTMNLQIN